MKYNLICLIIFFAASSGLFAQQKIGYVDSKIIIESMQDAKDAQTNLDNIVGQWKAELKQYTDSLATMKDDYDKKKLVLTETAGKQREEDIKAIEKKIEDYKTLKFGDNGEYFQKQNELMKPVQDKVFKAIQDVAKDGDYDFVIDRSSQLLLLYMNDKYDLTQKVIKKLEGK